MPSGPVELTSEWKDDWLASNPGFPVRILSRSFGEKSEGKPGRISHVIGSTVVTAVPCKRPKRHNVMGVALSQSA